MERSVRDVSGDIDDLIAHLEMLAGMENTSRAFATFILGHGRQWEAAALDDGIKRGVPRGCYRNSQKLLFSDMRRRFPEGLVYVEGYACSGSLNFALPLPHGWLVDPEGRVVDPTWDEPENSTYFGVPFNEDYVRETVKAYGPCSLIDNFHDRWLLVRDREVALRAVLEWNSPAASYGT